MFYAFSSIYINALYSEQQFYYNIMLYDLNRTQETLDYDFQY